jgi:Mg2+/Co2+ transporter CorB
MHTNSTLRRPSGTAGRSALGRVSVASGVLAVVGIVISIVGFATDTLRAAESFTDNWALTVFALTVLASAITAAVAGLLAILLRADRRAAVITATVIGGLISGLLLNELLQGL